MATAKFSRMVSTAFVWAIAIGTLVQFKVARLTSLRLTQFIINAYNSPMKLNLNESALNATENSSINWVSEIYNRFISFIRFNESDLIKNKIKFIL